MRTGIKAAEYSVEIQRLVRYLGVGNGNMQEGSLRCDVNISVRPTGQTEFGTKPCTRQSISIFPGRFFSTIKARMNKLYRKLDFGKRVLRFSLTVTYLVLLVWWLGFLTFNIFLLTIIILFKTCHFFSSCRYIHQYRK
ncbi:hypothetical protein MKX03_004154 [Papaver bracteatum]|nr:hypothetical protein MKX03_004154 [Papaver bracteatum]